MVLPSVYGKQTQMLVKFSSNLVYTGIRIYFPYTKVLLGLPSLSKNYEDPYVWKEDTDEQPARPIGVFMGIFQRRMQVGVCWLSPIPDVYE